MCNKWLESLNDTPAVRSRILQIHELHFYLTSGSKFAGSHLSVCISERASRVYLARINLALDRGGPRYTQMSPEVALRCPDEKLAKLAHDCDYDAFCDGCAGTPIGIHWRQFISADARRGWNLSVPLLPRPLNCTPVLIKRRRARREYPTARFCLLFSPLVLPRVYITMFSSWFPRQMPWGFLRDRISYRRSLRGILIALS